MAPDPTNQQNGHVPVEEQPQGFHPPTSFVKSGISASNNEHLDQNRTKQTQTRRSDNDPVAREAYVVAADVVLYFSDQISSDRPPNKTSRVMRKCVKQMLQKHEFKFNGMVSRLHIDERTGYNTFNGVADAVFSDKQVNWGRIVALYAFASRLGQYCRDNGMLHYADDIAEYLGQYVSENLLPWITENGGWKEFVHQYPDKSELDNKIWRGLLATAAVGLGALATLVAVK